MFNTSNGNGSLELWCKGNTSIGQNNNTINKTIYDPSPSYFKLPKSASFSGFVTSNTTTYINVQSLSGYFFYTIYLCQGNIMPLYQLGCRNPSSYVTDWNGINFSHGNWWTGIPNNNSNGFNLHTMNGGGNLQDNVRGYGLTVLSAAVE